MQDDTSFQVWRIMKINEKTLLNSSIRSHFSPHEDQGELNDYMMMVWVFEASIWTVAFSSMSPRSRGQQRVKKAVQHFR